METLPEKIQGIFDSAHLSPEDQSLWLDRLAQGGERLQAVFVSIFEDDIEMLDFFTQDLRNRIDCGSDRERLEKVLENEREYFRTLLAQA